MAKTTEENVGTKNDMESTDTSIPEPEALEDSGLLKNAVPPRVVEDLLLNVTGCGTKG